MDYKTYLNRGGKIQALSLGKNTSVRAAIEQLSVILQGLRVQCIIRIEMEVDAVVDALEMTEIKERVNVTLDTIFFIFESNYFKLKRIRP